MLARGLGLGVGQEEQFDAVESERSGQLDDRAIGGMALVGLELADEGDRAFDEPGDLALSEAKLASPRKDYRAKTASL